MPRRLYLLRHGPAVNRQRWAGEDSKRPLTNAGRQRVTEISGALEGLALKLEIIVTSPYARASQTAEIVARRFGKKTRIEVDGRLAPGFDAESLAEILKDQSKATSLLLIGHEPDLSETIATVIGGARLKFKKAGLARVDLARSLPLRGQLVWFMPPKLLGPFARGILADNQA